MFKDNYYSSRFVSAMKIQINHGAKYMSTGRSNLRGEYL